MSHPIDQTAGETPSFNRDPSGTARPCLGLCTGEVEGLCQKKDMKPKRPRRISFLRSVSAVIFCIACCLPAVPAFAAAPDDDAPVPEAGDKPPQPEEPLPDEAAEKPTDDELLKILDAETRQFADEAQDHLQHAFEGMQAARRRIADEDTGAETQKTQERVVKDLEALLALMKNQQSRGQQRPQQNQPQDKNQGQQQSDRQKMQNGQNDPQNSGTSKSSTKDKGSANDRRQDGPAADAEERTDAARTPTAEQARRMQVIKDVWGHLPPHVREAMLNSVSEKYLPKYEDLVKKYYEDLAEKSRKHHGK